ncbi:FtsQ-type POTRA domain-containing protein [[Pasteurella] aerogenes]|nr:FtsQ-type POTRA domain-containing protein [[Pasteurella] aerogenes]
MKLFQHKTVQGVRTKGQRSTQFLTLKPLFFLVFLGVLFYVYTNWQSWLEKLDSRPISAFALIGSPTFTTDVDVRDTLVKMGSLKGFFGQDIEAVREQIETMPWIKNAVVRKVWPDRLSIWVNEHFPVAIWNENEFVASDGTVFKLPMEKVKDQNLPHLSGPDYRSTVVLDAWNKIDHDLKLKGLTLKAVKIDARGAWQIVLDNDVTLRLGRGDWKTKLERFATIYPQIEVPEHKRLSYVDLRYNVGAAVGIVDAD